MAIDFPSSPTNGQSFGAFTYDSSLPGWRSTPEVASGLAAGTMVQWPGSTPPANWLICDGSAVSRSTYPSLFAAIGTTYGSGDGSTTFNLPNLKGRVAVGRDSSQTEFDTLGETGGAKTHTLTVSEMPSHTHQISVGTSADWNDYFAGSTNTYGIEPTYTGTPYTSPLSSVGGGGAHNNLQPYVVLNYIIKTSAGITAGDSELAARVGVLEGQNNATPLSPNYVINSGFDIWQRGTSTTIAAAAYRTADRWATWIDSGSGTISQDTTNVPAFLQYGIRYTSSGASGSCVFYHTIETLNAELLAGKTVNLSAYLSGTAGKNIQVSLWSSTTTDNAFTGSWSLIGAAAYINTASVTRVSASYTIPSNTKTVQIRVYNLDKLANTEFVSFTGVQLEEGAYATSFRRNAPNIQAELASCQRYYWRFTQVDNYYMFNSATCWSSAGEMIVNVSLPVTQRVTGTQAMTNVSSIYWLGNGTNLTNATSPSYRPTREAFVLVCTVPSQTATNTWAFRPLVNSYLESNAEL